MKRVKVEHNVDIRQLQEQIINKYKDDEYFIKVYQKLKANNNKLDLSDVIEVYHSQKKCLDCLSIDDCLQGVKGYKLDIQNNVIINKACEYSQNQIILDKEYKSLVYSTFKFNKKLPELKSIDITPNRVQVIEHLNKLDKNETNKGIFLSGAPGVGKTYIVEALLNSYLHKKNRCAYVLLNELFLEMKKYYFSPKSQDKDDYDRILTRLKNVDVLILDDIGAENIDAITRDEILFPILDYRMKTKKMTHFTSNYTLVQLEAHYTETSSRISEPIKAKRIIERIRVLSDEFILNEEKSRR